MLRLNNNPDLHGTVTKKLVLQCSGGITFSGCRPKYGDDGMNEEFLSFPYLVGMTFSSQNIDDIMLYRAELGMGDSMITEPPAVEITEEHGKKQKLCPWQKTWMDPLLKLRNCNIYVKSSTPEGPDSFLGAPTKKGYSFKEKFLNFARFADHDENMRRDSFDAAYGLPEGERAVSILDWERRIFLLVAKTNNLTIVHVKDGRTADAMGYDITEQDDDGKCIYKLNGKPTSPEWYCHYPEAEAEAIRRFKTRKMALA